MAFNYNPNLEFTEKSKYNSLINKENYLSILNNLSLMYVSCFTYNSVWHPFLKLRTKYIGDNEIKMFLCTDELKNFNINGNNLNILNYGKKSNFAINGNLFDRYLYYLTNIESEYILYFYDDMFPGKQINLEQLDKILNIMKNNIDIKIIKLSLSSYQFINGTEVIYDNIKFIRANNMLDEYIFNVQPLLIRRNFFIDMVNYCKENNTLTHQNGGLEIFGTEYFKNNSKFICLRVIEDIIEIPFGGILQSGILEPNIKEYLINKEGIDIKVYENNLIFELTRDEYNCLGDRLKEQFKTLTWKNNIYYE
jgi:hypothetical protein